MSLSFDRGSTLTCTSKLVFISIFMFMFLLGNAQSYTRSEERVERILRQLGLLYTCSGKVTVNAVMFQVFCRTSTLTYDSKPVFIFIVTLV